MQDLLYRIALTLVPGIGPIQARMLLQSFGEAGLIFQAKKSTLEKTEGIGSIRAANIKQFTDFKRAEKEMGFLDKYGIKPLSISDPAYPQRLLNCYDPPVLLYFKGNLNINAVKIIAVIGTRSNSAYGKQVTETLLNELVPFQVMVVSGLAYGIDALSHRAALKNGLPTIGVLAHGLDTIYPYQHYALAREMTQQGGLLTEFISATKPDRHHFPMRNRIVAGMSDAVIVIETGVKGGSMITADLANSYNKDVFAFPGKTTDPKSAGCNYLIKTNRAMLLTDAQQLIETMGWERKKTAGKSTQKELFIQLSEEEKTVVAILQSKDAVAIDELNYRSNLSSSKVAAAILNLELQGVVMVLPGKIYRLA
ncbi:MAG: DNA-protecting protein DprA [Williamsia sp.]|nr:DNA-protecting protein DprA [Williamsia sp.]